MDNLLKFKVNSVYLVLGCKEEGNYQVVILYEFYLLLVLVSEGDGEVLQTTERVFDVVHTIAHAVWLVLKGQFIDGRVDRDAGNLV